MHLFYTPNITEPLFTLTEEESKHAIRVLRLNQGDKVRLTNGKGQFFEAQITDAHPKRCTLEITQTQTIEAPSYKLHMAVAPTKSIDRFEWFLEKATEIGISEITPLLCDFSERQNLKPERLEKIIVSATKQSLQAYKPVLNSFSKFANFMGSLPSVKQKFIAHCWENDLPLLQNQALQGESLLLIGPEGDFSKEEVALAIENGFMEISLGKNRLRTETAGVAGCHIVALANA